MDILARGRAYIFGIVYRWVLKPVLFLMEPEKVHEDMLIRGAHLGSSPLGRWLIRSCFWYGNPKLKQIIAGIHFPNPVGLAAGFDKDGKLTQILPGLGSGFEEVGSVTAGSCAGNPGPHLWRLKKSKSIAVNYGLKNVGAEVIARSLAELSFSFPLGISLAKTNIPATIDEQAGIIDYIEGYTSFLRNQVGDYMTINISCPNACGGQPFLKPAALEGLLSALQKLRIEHGDKRPWFLKLAADIYPTMVDDVIIVARRYGVTGFICSNLTKNRGNKKIIDSNVPSVGGFSGAVVQELSTNLVRYIYKKTKGEFIIIGCGGIFSAEDAYEKIKAGASLVQMITGMIYQGPQLISEINIGLVRLLQRDGFSSISEAIGADYKE